MVSTCRARQTPSYTRAKSQQLESLARSGGADGIQGGGNRGHLRAAPTCQRSIRILVHRLYAGGALLFLAPLLVSLALKVNQLVGTEDAPKNLALIAGVSSLLAMISNPLFGRLSDRTTARMGMRRPWMLIGFAGGTTGIITVALAGSIPVVLVGWCVAQVFLNSLLAAQTAVLPDQVPTEQRGLVSGLLGICLPVASVAATYLVQAFDSTTVSMFLAPCVVGGAVVVTFTIRLRDRRLDRADRPAWSWAQLAGTFYVDPRRNPDFAWAFASRLLLVMAYATLVTYQAFYLIEQIGTDDDAVARQIYLGTLAQSAAIVAVSPLAGRLSDRVGRRKIFVILAAVGYACAMVLVATASSFGGYLVGMAIGGLGFGMYMAVDLALVVDVLGDSQSAAKDLGVMNVAGALPFALAPALASLILEATGGSYGVLFSVAAALAVGGAFAIGPIRRVR